MSSRAEDQGAGASTGDEGNPEHDVAFWPASDELLASGMPRSQRQTTAPDDGGSSNTSGRVGAFNVDRTMEGPPNAAAGPQGRTDQGPQGRNDDDNGPFKLAKTFLGLTFQAGLALMIYRKQPQQGDSSSANPSLLSSILLTSVGAATLFGFAFTMSGMMLQRHHPNTAKFCSCAGIFLGALGFFFMMDIFAGKGLDWLVWAVGGVLLLVFAYTLRRKMGV